MLSARILGLLAAGLIISSCGSAGASNGDPRGALGAAPAMPATGSAPQGFQAVDLSWISDDQGWAIGVEPGCNGQRCATLLETTDGGTQWVTVTDLHACLLEAAPVGCPAGTTQLSSIRFANADLGYAFSSDGGPALATTNGGLTWSLLPGREVSAIKVASGTAVRASFSKGGCPGPCDWSIDQAVVGGSQWRTLLTPPADVNHDRVVLLHQGPEYLYVAFLGAPQAGAGTQPAQLFISTDAGASWTELPDPCGQLRPGLVAAMLSSAPGGVLAALCAPRSGSGTQFVTVSTDAGANFGTLLPLPAAPSRYTELAIINPRTVFAAESGRQLVGTANGGRAWRVLARGGAPAAAPAPVFLGFESPTVGRWIAAGGVLWSTTDGGGSWHPRRF